jgi:threonine synthase
VAAHFGLTDLWLKREDLNPTGSHKARGLAFQVSALRSEGARVLLISSSGNAAVAAAAYAAAGGMHLVAFVAPGTSGAKLGPLGRHGARIIVTPNALAMAGEVSAATGLPNLRPSTDPLAVPGYMTLGWEIARQAPEAEAVFLFVGSGATLVGLHRARAVVAALPSGRWPAALHAVQGMGVAPVVDALEPGRPREPHAESRLGALGARKTRRVGEAARAVRDTGGRGWTVADDEADSAQAVLAEHGIETSLEGAAAVAAAGRAARSVGLTRAVAVLTGHASSRPDFAAVGASAVWRVGDLAEALAVVRAPW